MKRFILIACGVLKKEIDFIKPRIPSDIELIDVWLEQGLHREPKKLNKLIIEEISAIEDRYGDIDAILLGYGVCSSGTLGIGSDKYKVVIPRAHDCITLFLGSKEKYLDEFSKAPGTYWYTPGFIGGNLQPGMSEKYAGIFREYEENYESYKERFGDEELARFIIENQEQHWIKNYSRGAYVESGLEGGNALRKKAEKFCDVRNWKFETVKGDLSLLEDLISGKWDSERFLVLNPGERSVLGGVYDVIKTDSKIDDTIVPRDNFTKSYVYDEDYIDFDDYKGEFTLIKDNVVIGIDAGGTFTDAVIVSLRDSKVLASGKAPTTYDNLAIGIKNALLKLPTKLLKESNRLAISTTLATNAIVEGKGANTGLILIGYQQDVADRINIGSGDIKEIVNGCHDIYGIETVPFDDQGFIFKSDEINRRGVNAFAVSSYMGTRNPEHEKKAAEILKRRFNIPVVTGHELTDDIDSVRRAHTALLNARLLPIINSLVYSVKDVVKELGLSADIRIVTTDGSLMNVSEALEKPVKMVLSGPAASVKGVRFLTSVDSCVVVDMGGTTTDIAIIENGSARRKGRGAVVGKYKTSLHATDIRTLGLGGDSAIKTEKGKLKIGPERIIPISVLCDKHPWIIDNLKKYLGYDSGDYSLVQPGTFFLSVMKPSDNVIFNERENNILKFLSEKPLSLLELAEALDYSYLSLLGTERLEEAGIIRRCGLTPTDLMVLDDSVTLYKKEATEIVLNLFTERTGIEENKLKKLIWKEIQKKSAAAILTEVMSSANYEDSFPGCGFCREIFDGNESVDSTINLKIPVVGIGAPAKIMLNGLDSYLSSENIFPENAEVANAVGAAAGAGAMHIDISIVLDSVGRYIIYAPENMKIFRKLEDAKRESMSIIKEYSLNYAKRMNYDKFRLEITVKDRSAPTAFGNDIYIDTSIVAVMSY